MKVSIIVPLYNKSATIERALASIQAQTFRDFEVLVINDGSTDDGPSKVNGVGVRLICQANAGPGAARNRGIREAQGELLAFLDADDEWLPQYLEESVRILEAQPAEAACVTSGFYEWPAQVSREQYCRHRGLKKGIHRLTAHTEPGLVIAMLAYMSPCSTLARADVIRRHGGFFDRNHCLYGEDAFLWLKVLFNHPVAIQMKPLVRFHLEASELSKNLKGARPVEPFLEFPEEIRSACPSGLRRLLSQVLAIRAQKTACVLGYWGKWLQARALRRHFHVPGLWRLPYYFPALVCSTPVGGWVSEAWRWLRSLRVSVMNPAALD
jgi:glycosyltransferase involved in cell wall biosynthesis